jgi:hypothetical protein
MPSNTFSGVPIIGIENTILIATFAIIQRGHWDSCEQVYMLKYMMVIKWFQVLILMSLKWLLSKRKKMVYLLSPFILVTVQLAFRIL